MLFVHSEEQRLITEAARKLFDETCTVEQLRQMLEVGSAMDAERWLQIRAMGLPGMLVPEAAGGLGLEAPDFVGVAEAAGYVALPEPVVEQAGIVIPLLAAMEGGRRWLDRALAGSVVALAHPRQRLVSDVCQADALLLADGDEVHLVERPAVEFVRQPSVDPFRRLYSVSWQTSPETRICEGAPARAHWALAFERGALFSAAQCLGLAQRCVDLAVAYARDRQQFGKPIGSYQAVKHMLASVQVQIEFARPVLHAAAAELAGGGVVAEARVSHAKLAAGEVADLAARTALQVHGAMGYTWEVDLHFFMKRALALGAAWGSEAFHRERVLQRMQHAPIGPDALFASEIEVKA